ncbi:TPA: neutral/alkaline ceramidase [Legionella anisa]|uniref:neutral/alkaline ceramidase n=1 Tax=Legionella anisa TaxID=28082 RepID=UPI00135F165A|nr:neutral/alkaline ceramidase [Legionella anisa]MBN5936016.1 neutral/alkaline ceramidase [Legionella anisa]MCW8424091.1 neutral/alkaline ceramidase [Legionella anisa]MCW8447614.1 neutral/alkaline ceramidase [Legionella anisa]UAK80874.1 neutral/alkaline ceramidase [Legionella anisa]
MLRIFLKLNKLFLSLIFISLSCSAAQSPFIIGAGIYDITGAAAEINMLGYAQLQQYAQGIHSRLWSRAFIIASPDTGKRVVFVSADLGMIFQSIKQGVIKELQDQYGDLYNDKNVMISATHTHSGTGGYAFEHLYNFTIRGFYKKNYKAVVNGIVQSIIRAHQNLEPGNIYIETSELTNTSKNRSVSAYLKNPEEERNQYEHDTDKSFTLIKLVNEKEEPIGTINWHAVHGVSMSNKNVLISGDNKGYASYLFEKSMQSDYLNPKTFVAAFAQANEGDNSPNIFDSSSDGDCDKMTCLDIQHTFIIGERQYRKAKELFDAANTPIGKGVDYRHQYLDMENTSVGSEFTGGAEEHTCRATLGYSFGAGTTDGPGLEIFFHQGQLETDPFFVFIRDIIKQPTPSMIRCQQPKPILLAVGLNEPAWVPHNMPVQIFKIGDLVIAGVPGEFTTMSGRRIKNLLHEAFLVPEKHVVIAGLSNSYAGYITTPEEYMQQNYEGGFTVFGPWTLPAYLQGLKQIALDMIYQRESDPGPLPEDLSDHTGNIIPSVVFDDVPPTLNFGSVHLEPEEQYQRGELVHVIFWAGHPRNNLETMKGFLEVQRNAGGEWQTIAHDWDFNTVYRWERIFIAYAYGHVYWKIPADAIPGTYRIKHLGHYKYGWNQQIYPYEGISKPFKVI